MAKAASLLARHHPPLSLLFSPSPVICRPLPRYAAVGPPHTHTRMRKIQRRLCPPPQVDLKAQEAGALLAEVAALQQELAGTTALLEEKEQLLRRFSQQVVGWDSAPLRWDDGAFQNSFHRQSKRKIVGDKNYCNLHFILFYFHNFLPSSFPAYLSSFLRGSHSQA